MRSRLSEMGVSIVGDYANELNSEPYLQAKRGRSLKKQARQLENVITIGNWLYRSIRRIEHNWRTEVLQGRTPYDPNEEKSIGDMLRQWTVPSLRCLDEIESLQRQNVPVRGARNFQAYCAAASEILAGRDTFFDDTARAWQWSALTARFRSSPRPVSVDDMGRVFELSGARFVPAGLTREDMRDALSGRDEGDTKSLDEIIASRPKNGL